MFLRCCCMLFLYWCCLHVVKLPTSNVSTKETPRYSSLAQFKIISVPPKYAAQRYNARGNHLDKFWMRSLHSEVEQVIIVESTFECLLIKRHL